MLEHLSINSLGVIEETTVELDPGFTVVTGETGAGKTMVVTALNVLLGARADAGAIRAGDTKAAVEAGFVLPPEHRAITAAQEAGAVLDEENDLRHLVITRSITASGSGTRSRATAGDGEYLLRCFPKSGNQRWRFMDNLISYDSSPCLLSGVLWTPR